jgi:hypothetical protein
MYKQTGTGTNTSVVDPNPKKTNVLAGSESEKNFRFGFSHGCKMKIFVKNQKSNT